MGTDPDRGHVRLAELVAALSLGIDLGFGQPMEHVLRQCLIALRLAERLGAEQGTRAVVYYTGLLVNVGCHTDAHEQAKWFGDDIALRATKYDHEPTSVRARASAMRRLGSGNPPLQRLRVGLAFATFGHRDLDDMFASHAELAARLADELGLPEGVGESLRSAYEAWDGRGWPNGLEGDADSPGGAHRRARRVLRGRASRGRARGRDALARQRSGTQFDPALVALLCANAATIFGDLDSVGTWDAVIDAEPALNVAAHG